MKLKPKSTVHNTRALLYKRFTDVDKSFNTKNVYKTADNKLWVIDREKYGGTKTQCVSNSNIVSTEYWTAMSDLPTLSAVSNMLVCSVDGTVNNKYATAILNGSSIQQLNHKYYWRFDYKLPDFFSSTMQVYIMGKQAEISSIMSDGEWHSVGGLSDGENTEEYSRPIYIIPVPKGTLPRTATFVYSYRKISVYDLTVDFGVGNEPTDLAFCDKYYTAPTQSPFVEVETTATSTTITSSNAISYDGKYYKYSTASGWEVATSVGGMTLLSATFANIGSYQTNKYYLQGSFDYMVKGGIDSEDTQPIKGLITPLTSFTIRTFDDNINLDHDDLVVIDGHLYSIESIEKSVLRRPKPFNIYFATLNSIL